MLAGKAIMINWCNVAEPDRAAYYDWHGREHMVGRVAIPGFQRGRRLIAVRAIRNFLNFYEVADLSVLTGDEYRAKANAPSELTRSTTRLIKDSIRALAKVRMSFGVGDGGYMLTLRLDPPADIEAKLGRYLAQALERIATMSGITGAHFCVADQAASTFVSEERKGRPTIVPNWIVMLEGVSLDALERACDAHLAQALSANGYDGAVERDTYSQQITVSKPSQ